MLMMGILDEAKADQEVIKSLTQHIKMLEEQLKMSKILFDAEGKIFRTNHFEEVTTAELDEEVLGLQSDIDELKSIKDAAAKVSTPAVTTPVDTVPPTVDPTATPVAPVDAQPVAAPTTDQVAAPVVTDPSVVAADPTIAVDSTVQPPLQ